MWLKTDIIIGRRYNNLSLIDLKCFCLMLIYVLKYNLKIASKQCHKIKYVFFLCNKCFSVNFVMNIILTERARE